MPQYMLLIKSGGEREMSPGEMGAVVEKYIAWSRSLRDSGCYVSANELQDESKIVRRQGQDFLVSDGPFAETKEAIGGYFIIEAQSMEAAIEIAKGCPAFDSNGTLELHEVIPH